MPSLCTIDLRSFMSGYLFRGYNVPLITSQKPNTSLVGALGLVYLRMNAPQVGLEQA